MFLVVDRIARAIPTINCVQYLRPKRSVTCSIKISSVSFSSYIVLVQTER